MKLLIVDDEKLTRDGLLSSINWDALGISQVFQADDGVNGLELARQERPEIVLCDVRMPRMDGILMAQKIEALLPDTAVIFMSGYSDKEYLKAAIKLQAVNYVEKPLNLGEIQDAVLEAKERFEQRMRTIQNEAFHSLSTVSALALALTRPYREQKETIAALSDELSLRFTSGDSFTTYLVCLKREADTGVMDPLRQKLDTFLEPRRLQAFYAFKHEQYHVFHIFSHGKPSRTLLADIDGFLAEQYAPFAPFLAVRGETASGISRAYQSYTSAVTLMQSAFFFDCGEVIVPVEPDAPFRGRIEPPAADADAFAAALEQRDAQACRTFLEQTFAAFSRRRDVFAHQAKDAYYKLFMTLQESRQKGKLSLSSGEAPRSVMAFLEDCFTLEELHRALEDDVEAFFRDAGSQTPENSTIFLIKEYIGRHYADESLSVREISEHVLLSASYVCTYFKNETGQTLNQYLTAYRIEKAKQLLSDPRYQISDISARVGYSNGNYFSKSFKKLVGLSPSEYREKMLQ